MPCITSLIQKCSYLGNRKIIFGGQAWGSRKCVENVTVKIRLHRMNGGEVKYTVFHVWEEWYRAKQDDGWGSGQRESQGHGVSLGDINIDLWSAESQIYAMSAVWSSLVLIGYTPANCSYPSCRLDWENSTSADRACCSPLEGEKKKSHPVKEHFCWYDLIHTRGFCWHSYAGCRSHFSTSALPWLMCIPCNSLSCWSGQGLC